MSSFSPAPGVQLTNVTLTCDAAVNTTLHTFSVASDAVQLAEAIMALDMPASNTTQRTLLVSSMRLADPAAPWGYSTTGINITHSLTITTADPLGAPAWIDAGTANNIVRTVVPGQTLVLDRLVLINSCAVLLVMNPEYPNQISPSVNALYPFVLDPTK